MKSCFGTGLAAIRSRMAGTIVAPKRSGKVRRVAEVVLVGPDQVADPRLRALPADPDVRLPTGRLRGVEGAERPVVVHGDDQDPALPRERLEERGDLIPGRVLAIGGPTDLLVR